MTNASDAPARPLVPMEDRRCLDGHRASIGIDEGRSA